MAYETHEKRAFHCAAVHNREHDGDERLEYQGVKTEPSPMATMSGAMYKEAYRGLRTRICSAAPH